jgi:predicted ArsR family transcriptional regulator
MVRDIIQAVETARQRILDQIRSKRSCSAGELSLALGTTPANIRHHLAILLNEGAIELVDQRRGAGRGRPTRLYALARQAHAHNLDKLAGVLLQELLEGLQPEERMAAILRIADRLGEPAGATGSLTQRLNACVQLLNDMNYQARWEARSSGPRVVFAHCPYAVILPEHPELCQMDASLLEGVLEASVVQAARLLPSRQGGKVCIFAVGSR